MVLIATSEMHIAPQISQTDTDWLNCFCVYNVISESESSKQLQSRCIDILTWKGGDNINIEFTSPVMFLLNTCESRVMVAPVWTITGNGSIEILSRLAGSGLPSGKNDEKSWIWFFQWFHRKSRIPLLLEAPPGNYWIDFFSTNQNCDIKHKGNIIERRFLL